MNFRGLVALCLLAVYGLPASIGPFWHRHHPGCADCSRSSESVDAKFAELNGSVARAPSSQANVVSSETTRTDDGWQSVRRCHSNRNCCCRAHAQTDHASRTDQPKRVAHSSRDDHPSFADRSESESKLATESKAPCHHDHSHDHRGHCSVCDFYAKAYYLLVTLNLPEVSEFVYWQAIDCFEASFCRSYSRLARGPPSI